MVGFPVEVDGYFVMGAAFQPGGLEVFDELSVHGGVLDLPEYLRDVDELELQDADDIEQTVVYHGAGREYLSSACLPAVADRPDEDAMQVEFMLRCDDPAFVGDEVECLEYPCQGIGTASQEVLQLHRGLGRDLRAETRCRHIDEVALIGFGDIYGGNVSVYGKTQGFQAGEGNGAGRREVVGRPKGHDSEYGALFPGQFCQGVHGFVDRAVAAAYDETFRAVCNGFFEKTCHIAVFIGDTHLYIIVTFLSESRNGGTYVRPARFFPVQNDVYLHGGPTFSCSVLSE